MPGDSGATVVTNARAYYHYTRGCGCIGHPAFPTPFVGREAHAQLGRYPRRENAEVYLAVIASEAIHSFSGLMNCFAEPVIGRAFARPVGSQ